MALSVIDETNSSAEAAATLAKTDRRRAGRTEVNPSLLPLLRRPASAGTAPMAASLEDLIDAEGPGDTLAPARGIAIGLMLSVALWGAIAGLGFALFR